MLVQIFSLIVLEYDRRNYDNEHDHIFIAKHITKKLTL